MRSWQQVRQEIPALRHSIYMNTGTLGPSPWPVHEAFLKEYSRWQTAGPGWPAVYAGQREGSAGLRQRLAAFLGVGAGNLALLGNSTDAINTVFWGLPWQAEDELIITDQEHPAIFLPALQLARRFGIRIKILPWSVDAEQMATALSRLLGPRSRLVAVSHVSSMTGWRFPAEALAVARQAAVPVLLDGSQAVGQERVAIAQLGCAFYALNGHKWLLAPVGTGALYVADAWLERLEPSWTGGDAGFVPEYPDNLTLTLRGDARRFEFATRNWPLFAGWNAALTYLEEVGWEAIWGRNLHLADRLVQALEPWRRYGLEVLTAQPGRGSALVTVRVKGWTAEALSGELEKRRVITRVVHELQAVRFSCAFYNTEDEIDHAAADIGAIVGA